MISIVYSTKSDKPSFIEDIKKTSGIHKIEVIQIINDGEMSLTQAYNKGLEQTTNNIVVFCHDDIIFDTKNWGRKLKSIFDKNPSYGIIGIAGTTDLVDGRWWTIKESMNGIVSHKHEGKKWRTPPRAHTPTGALVRVTLAIIDTFLHRKKGSSSFAPRGVGVFQHGIKKLIF